MTDVAFLVEFGALTLGLGLLGKLAGRIGLSAIPFYLLGGLVAGAGGLVELDRAVEFTEDAASVGVILLLLLLGLEYTQQELFAGLRRDGPSGLVDLVLNATPGAVAALVAGWGWQAALALGGITYISSSGVVARLLNDFGRMANRETPAILSVLVIEDLAMAAYLPVLGVVLGGEDFGGIVVAVSVSLGLVALALVGARRLGPRLSGAVADRSGEVVLLTVLGLTVLVAGLAESVHVSAAVAAFLVGIALSGEVAERARTMLHPVRDLFAALFFVSIGLGTDIGTVVSALGGAVALGLVTALTKVVTGWYTAKRAGVGVRGRMRAGTALIARGEFSLVIAALAVGGGVAAELQSLTTAYIILLAIAAPIVTRYADAMGDWILRRQRGERLQAPAIVRRPPPSWAPEALRGRRNPRRSR